jgi:polyphosphate glucokinase
MGASETNSTLFNILAIDIGGSNIKASVLDQAGNLLQEYKKLPTPENATPEKVLEVILELVKEFIGYEKISVGFPGYVKKGVVYTAPNLGTEFWQGVDLSKLLSNALKKPARVLNDADMQGLGVVSGQGLEMVITLGTGFGTAIINDGVLLPHLELAHHAVTKNKTYDEYVGNEAFEKEGEEKWNRRMSKVITMLKGVFNYDRLYIGGGNAKKLNFKLDDNIIIVSNKEGIKGGARVWLLEEKVFK